MITGELKNKVDQIWQTIWTGGITRPDAFENSLAYFGNSGPTPQWSVDYLALKELNASGLTPIPVSQ